MANRTAAEIDQVFEELDQLLKNPDVGAELAAGRRQRQPRDDPRRWRPRLPARRQGGALLELGTATEEIAARMAARPRGAAS